jgi:D-hexose-6-phosphate mutarotase
MTADGEDEPAALPERRAPREAAGASLRFREGPGGLAFLDVHNAAAAATICLQGAQLLAWQPHSQAQPVIWLSQAARFAPGRPIRGGIPICWPWFGPHPAGGGALPSHGFARTVAWQVTQVECPEAGLTQIVFLLRDDPGTRDLWPHAFVAELRLDIGAQLRAELATVNCGPAEIELSEALHAYFHVGDIAQAQVVGLQGARFVDSAAGGAPGTQEGPIRIAGELDRVYLDAPSECVIADALLGRRIRIGQSGASSVVVWNPGPEKAARLGDLGPGARGQGGWREMLCVESGNVLANRVRVAPGATHRMFALYQVG